MSKMHEVGDFQTAQTLETFSFLPELSKEEIHLQVQYIISQGWTPAIEHEHPGRAMNHYWTMWKLPFFGENNLANVMNELDTCRRTYPDHHVRLTGYDNYTQSQGSCFVVYQGRS